MLGAAKRDAAMRTGADAGIVVAAPIEQVVAQLSSGPRVVRDFVGRQSRALAQLLGEEIEGSAPISPSGIGRRAGGMRAANGVPSSMVS